MRALLDAPPRRGLDGPRRDPAAWDGRYDAIDADELWAARREQRAALVSGRATPSMVDRLRRDEPLDYVEAAPRRSTRDVLTIGFARRLATYKRLHVLLHDAPRGSSTCSPAERPIQLLMAGKAHPRDETASAARPGAVRGQAGSREIGRRVAFLDDYDLTIATWLVPAATSGSTCPARRSRPAARAA